MPGVAKILIVEDDAHIRRLLRATMQRAGHDVAEAADARAALALLDIEKPDVVLLDLGLPDRDGLELIGPIRQRSAATIIVVSARDDSAEKVAALDLGADDYLTKPFELAELEVRLEALAVRAGLRARTSQLQVDDLVLDLATLEVQRGGRAIHLYPACRTLLSVLMQSSPAAVTRERLEAALWGDDPPAGDLLRSHVYDLRRAIDAPFETKLLHTLPRVGYRIALLDEGNHEA